MAKVTYNPSKDPADAMPDETEAYGLSFKKGNAVDVTDTKILAKLSGNQFFEVDDKDAKRPM